MNINITRVGWGVLACVTSNQESVEQLQMWNHVAQLCHLLRRVPFSRGTLSFSLSLVAPALHTAHAPVRGSPEEEGGGRGLTMLQLWMMFMIFDLQLMLDEEGRSRRFGFVAFENPQSALAAVIGLHGKQLGDNKFLYVARALSKAERQQEINRKLEERKRQKAGQIFYY